jgi:hypothetical protein
MLRSPLISMWLLKLNWSNLFLLSTIFQSDPFRILNPLMLQISSHESKNEVTKISKYEGLRGVNMRGVALSD